MNITKNSIIVCFILLVLILGLCSQPANNVQVKKGSSYDNSYDSQIDDLKRDLQKSDYDGIVIYDDNCDTVLELSK